MKLQKMTDFVLERNIINSESHEGYEQTAIESVSYAKFLKQSLELAFFIPVDDEENVLTEPRFLYQEYDLQFLKGIELSIAKEINENVKKYQIAKEKILFINFPLDAAQHHIDQNRTIEYFTNSNLPDLYLTKTAVKQIFRRCLK